MIVLFAEARACSHTVGGAQHSFSVTLEVTWALIQKNVLLCKWRTKLQIVWLRSRWMCCSLQLFKVSLPYSLHVSISFSRCWRSRRNDGNPAESGENGCRQQLNEIRLIKTWSRKLEKLTVSFFVFFFYSKPNVIYHFCWILAFRRV